MSKVDILYLSHKREEFTNTSLATLLTNTNPNLVSKLVVTTDGERAPARFIDDTTYPHSSTSNVPEVWRKSAKFGWLSDSKLGGPGAAINNYVKAPREHFHDHYCEDDCTLTHEPDDRAEFFAKLDNDVIVPPGWLEAALAVMERNPNLDILGLEPPHSRVPSRFSMREHKLYQEPEMLGVPSSTGFVRVAAVGGIFIARRRAFADPIRSHQPNGIGGFTEWQMQHPSLTIGWIVPPLKLFLLDRLPFEPWMSITNRYVTEGVQRTWSRYPATEENEKALWGWWVK